jgi:hypothetical protein
VTRSRISELVKFLINRPGLGFELTLLPPTFRIGIDDDNARLVLPLIPRQSLQFCQVLLHRAQIPIGAPVAQVAFMGFELALRLNRIDKPRYLAREFLKRLRGPGGLHFQIEGDEMPDEPDFFRFGP